MKKENMKLKSITKDDDKVTHDYDYDKVTYEVKEVKVKGDQVKEDQKQQPHSQGIDIYKNYIPLCLIASYWIGIIYVYVSKNG